jgi:hypothetical protein
MTGLRTEPRLQDLPVDTLAPGEALHDQAPTRRTVRHRRRKALRILLLALIGVLAIAAIVSIVWRPTAPEVAPRGATPAPRSQYEPPAAPRYPIESAAAKARSVRAR